MLQPLGNDYGFNPYPQAEPQPEQKPQSVGMLRVSVLNNIAGVALWFVISMNTVLYSRDSDNRNWVYIALLLIKGTTVSLSISKGGREGVASGIASTSATILGAIAGSL